MKRLILLLCIVFLFVPSGLAFEDTFQYYPGGDMSDVYTISLSAGGGGYASITPTNYGGTYTRNAYITAGGTGTVARYAYMTTIDFFSTSYISFVINGGKSNSACGGSDSCYAYVVLYDTAGVQILSHQFYGQAGASAVTGLYEYTLTSGNVYLRRNGVDQGLKGTSSLPIGRIRFYIYTIDASPTNGASGTLYVDDISTDGNLVSFGTESTSHILTESNLQPTDISWTAYSFPFADFTAASYDISVQRFVNGVYTELTNDEVKTATGTTPLQGYESYTRDVNFTDSDTSYGLYWAFLQKDGSNIANDYFFLQPPGGTSSISFADANIIIGQSETISYSINAPNYADYNYHVRVYSPSAQVFSQQVLTDSGTVTWDTTGESAGLYFAVLSRTEKADASNYDELTYDTSTLSANILISGYTYDAQNGTALDNVSINFSQGATWYNTTSNATGYYELLNLDVSIPTNVNASKTGWQHENFTFTPLIAQAYDIDLYLFNSTPTFVNTSILGFTYTFPYHQKQASIRIENETQITLTTSNASAYYILSNLTNDTTYQIHGDGSGFFDGLIEVGESYNVTVVNDSFVIQNVGVYEELELTVTAQDSVTSANIQEFNVLFNGTTYSTTNGSVTISGIYYGLYTVQVSSDGYYASSQSILVDESKTEVFTLSQVTSNDYYPNYVYEKFIVRSLYNTPYPGATINIYNGTESSVLLTGTTDSMGQAVFKLTKDQYYTVTVSGGGISGTLTFYVYGKEEEYIITVIGGFPTGGDRQNDISVNITSSTFNATYNNISLIYSDSRSSTTGLLFNVTNLTTNTTSCSNSSTSSAVTINCTVLASGLWKVSFNATSTVYGDFERIVIIDFNAGDMDTPAVETNIDSTTLNWISIILIVLLASMFSIKNVKFGAVLVPLFAAALYAIGWFDTNIVIIGSAVVLGILAYMRMQEVKVEAY